LSWIMWRQHNVISVALGGIILVQTVVWRRFTTKWVAVEQILRLLPLRSPGGVVSPVCLSPLQK